jgi:putative ABC transport system permease protein
VVGSRISTLIAQFLAESIVFTVISLIRSLILFIILLPKFNLLAGKNFDLHVVFTPVVLLSLLAIILIVGILGGGYPAFFLSRFSPVTVLKGEITQGSAGSIFRKIPVIVQITVSVIMIVCTLIVFRQLKYLKTMDQGFDQKNVVHFSLTRR